MKVKCAIFTIENDINVNSAIDDFLEEKQWKNIKKIVTTLNEIIFFYEVKENGSD